MIQPPYRLPEDRPMRRFAIFVAVLTVIVAVGYSLPSQHSSSKGSVCVCLPSRAGMMLKSMVNRSTVTTVHAASIKRIADKAMTAQ